MLELGGNAIDAAVAAALVAGVIEPTETTLAGSGFLLYSDGDHAPWSVEFGPKAPLAASPRMFDIDDDAADAAILGIHPVKANANVDGPLASGVPRTLLGLLSAHEKWGTLDRTIVCQPAIEAAYGGFASDSWFVLNAMSDLHRLTSDDMCRKVFLASDGLPKGRSSLRFYGASIEQGQTICQPELGATLEEVAGASLQTLVDGAIAARLAETSQEMGGILTLADFQASVPSIGAARTLPYREAHVSVPNSPGGGLTELQILKIWEALTASPATSHESPHLTRKLALAIRHAFADRYHWLGDPAVVPVPESALLEPEYIQEIAAICEHGEDVPGWRGTIPWRTFAVQAAHAPSLGDEPHLPLWSPLGASTPTSGTTHISATDVQGRTVAITHTAANHFGNGIICPRTGLLFDSAMAWFNAYPGAANSISSGARPLANMGPALVTEAGRSIAIGASGGRRIVSAVAQVIINMIDGGLSAREALELPRIDASGPTIVLPESRAEALEQLQDLGCSILPASNDPYAIDYARPNIAVSSGGVTSSVIESAAYGD